MIRPSLAALGAVVILAGNLYAEKPNTKPLHDQINALRKQEKATIAAIRAQYHNILHRDRVEESVLIKEREALLIQEKELLAITPVEEHAAIRERVRRPPRLAPPRYQGRPGPDHSPPRNGSRSDPPRRGHVPRQDQADRS